MAALSDIIPLAEKYNARIFVDDAHGNGALGENGGGVTQMQGVEEKIDLHGGTFSKAFGTAGGFIAGDKSAIDYLRFRSPTNIFTKSQAALIVAATIKSLEIVQKAGDLRKKLWDNTQYLQAKLKNMGFNIGRTETAVTPVQFNGVEAIFVARELRENFGIWVSPIVYPAVPPGKSIIRITPTAKHNKEQIDTLCESLLDLVCKKLVGCNSQELLFNN